MHIHCSDIVSFRNINMFIEIICTLTITKIPHRVGIHGNIGPRGICKTPTSHYAALCGSYNSSVISYADLKAAYGAGFECYMCGLTTDGIYFFCQGSPGYCTRVSEAGNSCVSCRNIYCKHSLGKFGQFTMISYEGHWRGYGTGCEMGNKCETRRDILWMIWVTESICLDIDSKRFIWLLHAFYKQIFKYPIVISSKNGPCQYLLLAERR